MPPRQRARRPRYLEAAAFPAGAALRDRLTIVKDAGTTIYRLLRTMEGRILQVRMYSPLKVARFSGEDLSFLPRQPVTLLSIAPTVE